MGLDNGFEVKGLKRSEIPSFVKYIWYDWYKPDQDIELVYWRKCWGLREAVLKVLHGEPDRYEFKVEAEDIPAIIRAIQPFFSKEYWEEEGDSVWTFEEKFPSLIQDVINLTWLKDYLESHPDSECYFYDSY